MKLIQIHNAMASHMVDMCRALKRSGITYWMGCLLTLLSFSSTAAAWSGDVGGELSVDDVTTRLRGSGSYADGELSLLGNLTIGDTRRAVLTLKLELSERDLGESTPLDQRTRALEYVEFNQRGATIISGGVAEGVVSVEEIYSGVLQIGFQVSVTEEGRQRIIQATSIIMVDPQAELSREMRSEPEIVLVLQPEEPTYDSGSGCDYQEPEPQGEVYVEDESGCDSDSSSTSGFASTGGNDSYYDDSYYDDSYYDDSYSDYGDDDSYSDYGDDDSDSCAEDDFTAEASSPQRKRYRSPLAWRISLRLLPIFISTLFIMLWRRRLRQRA